MNAVKVILVLAVGSGLAAGGCNKEESTKSTTAKPPAAQETPATNPPTAEPAESSADFVHGIMKPYEECRALLASDKADGIAICAKGMSEAAKAGQANAPQAAKESLAAIVIAAETLAGVQADDIAKARVAYGEVSKPVVALLTAVPAAAKNYHVFECPMAEGYKRWAQADKTLSNPYMGTKMLECGSETHDHHMGMGGEAMMDKGDDGMRMKDHAHENGSTPHGKH